MKTSVELNEQSARNKFASLATALIDPVEFVPRVFGKYSLPIIDNVWNSSKIVQSIYARINRLTEISLEQTIEKRIESEKQNIKPLPVLYLDYTHGPYHAKNVAYLTAVIVEKSLSKNPKYAHIYNNVIFRCLERALSTALFHDTSRQPYNLSDFEVFRDQTGKTDHAISSAQIGDVVFESYGFSTSERKEMYRAIAHHSNPGYGKITSNGTLSEAVMDGDGIDRHANHIPYSIFRSLLLNKRTLPDIKNIIFSHRARFQERIWLTQEAETLYRNINERLRNSESWDFATILDNAFKGKAGGRVTDKSAEEFMENFALYTEDQSLMPFTMAFLKKEEESHKI